MKRRAKHECLRRGLGPLLVGAALYLGLIGVWKLALVPRFPDVPFLDNLNERPLLWVKRRVGPVHYGGDLERAQTIFLGDSRVHCAVVREILDAAPFGPVATLWGGSAQLVELLPAAAGRPAERVVVALSPLSIWSEPDPLDLELLRRPPPRFAQQSFERELREWSATQRAQLLERGYFRQAIEDQLRNWAQIHKSSMRSSLSARWIDLSLARWLDRLRTALVRPIVTTPWELSWFHENDPGRSDDAYRRLLQPKTHERRLLRLQRLEDELHRLRAAGREVVCLRLPIAPNLLAIEEQALAARELSALCERAEVSYLDLSSEPFATRDGSHLTRPAAEDFSRRLAADLQRIFKP